MKSRRKARAARARKRDAKGHFVKSGSAEPKRRRRRRKARRTAAAEPRRTRRSRRRRSSKRNPWYGHPRLHAKAARKGWRHRRAKSRRRRRSSAALAPRRRGRRAALSASIPARVRSGGRSAPANINVRVNLANSKRGSSKRRGSRSRRGSSRRRGRSRRRSHVTYTPPSHQLTAGEYTLSNPLSGGELLLVGITGGIFYALADMAGRYMATAPVATGAAMNSVPSGQTVPNDVAVSAFPSWKTMAAQVAVAAVPGIASAFIDNPWGRAAAQGAMLGAGFNFLGGIFKGVMAMMLNQNALGQQLYLPEIEAQNAVTAAGGSTTAASAGTTTTAPAATGTGTGRLPHGVGKRFVGRDPGPMARGLGQQQTPVAMPLVPPPGITTNTGEQLQSSSPGTPIPGGPSTGPMCAPCSSTDGGIASTYDTALAATREDGCLGRFPGDMFPDDYHAAAA